MNKLTDINTAELAEQAEKGDLKAIIDVAYMYEHGTLLPQDDELAFSWYSKAASENNDAYAQMKLSEMYNSGMGVCADFDKSVEWLVASAKQNYLEAIFRLAMLTYHAYPYSGSESEDCFSKALELMIIAAHRGHPYACFMAGQLSVKKGDIELARAMFTKGAQRGHRECGRQLSKLEKSGSPQDEAEVPDEEPGKGVVSFQEWKQNKGDIK